MKFLFIDDDRWFLALISKIFKDNPNVACAECHSVEEALRAVAEHSPDVVFLDHQLTRGGREGLEIADRVKGVKIYTTTNNADDESLLSEYRRRGILRIGKADLKAYRAIIET